MIEWWQALALSAVGGIVAFIIAYFQNRWSLVGARDAADREARRRMRMDRLHPVFAFIEAIQRTWEYESQDRAADILSKALKEQNATIVSKSGVPIPEEVARNAAAEVLEPLYGGRNFTKDVGDMLRAADLARMAAPTMEIRNAVDELCKIEMPQKPETLQKLFRLIEEYTITGAA